MKREYYKNGKLAIATLCGLIIYCMVCLPAAYANNVQVAISDADITIADENISAGTLKVNFRLSQDNPFPDDARYDNLVYGDYIWVFLKYTTLPLNTNVGYRHATLVPFSGITGISGSSVGSYSSTTGEGVAGDGKGAFIKASRAGTGNNFSLLWKFTDDGVPIDAEVKIKVFAIEMVKIPTGGFYYNVGASSSSVDKYNNFTGTGAIPTLVSSSVDLPSGALQGWPNGFNSFYIMKYEVSQQQYIDFLNTLSATGQAYWNYWYPYFNYDYNPAPYYWNCSIQRNSSADADGGYWYISNSDTADRGCPFLSWNYGIAYASWAGLRPMTEMEFEKAARGTKSGSNKQAIYPWGDVDPLTGNSTYDPDAATTIYKYYGNFHIGSGVSKVGHYLSADISRTSAQTGASPYGVADLTGNLWEPVINCQSTLIPKNGDGKLHSSYLTDLNWPMTENCGIRGGDFRDNIGAAPISQRNWTNQKPGNGSNNGFRCARTPG